MLFKSFTGHRWPGKRNIIVALASGVRRGECSEKIAIKRRKTCNAVCFFVISGPLCVFSRCYGFSDVADVV